MSRVVQSLRPDGSTSSQVVAPTRRSVLTRTGTLLAESLGAAAAAAGGPTQPHIVGQGALRSFAPLSTGSRPVARSPSPPLSGRSSQTSVDLTLTAATPSAALAEAPGRGTAVDSRLTDTHIHRPLSTVTHAGSTLRVGSYGVILEDLLTMIWYTGQPHALHCTGTTAGLLNAVRSLDETLTSKGLCVCAGSVQELLQSAQRRLHKIRDQTDLKLLAQFFIAPVRVVEPLKFGSVSTRVSNLRLVSFPLMVMLIEMVADLLTKEGAVGAKWRQTTQARQFQDVTTSEVGFQFMLQTLLGQGIIELAYAVAKPVLDKLNLWPWWDLGANVRQHTAHAVAPPAAEACRQRPKLSAHRVVV